MVKGKRGEFAASELGEWSLYIVGFVIVLIAAGGIFFLLTQSNEDELCKLSVLSRATSPIGGAQQAIPLKCTAKKICFTSGKGECKEQFAGEKNVRVIKIPEINDVNDNENMKKAAEIIEEESANKMYECWRLMGEGKLDLFNNFGKELGTKASQTTCVICSRLAVDKNSVPDEILKEMGEKYIDINEHLKTARVTQDSKMTYLQAFLDSRDVQGFASVKENIFKSKDLDQSTIDKEYNDKVLSGKAKEEFNAQKTAIAEIAEKNKDKKPGVNREMVFVFMQIKSVGIKEVLGKMAQVGATLAGTTFVTPVARTAASKLIFTPTGGIILGGAAITLGGYGAWNAYQGQLTAASHCGEFTSNEKDREGCSLLQGLNYNKEEVNALCSSFQGRLYDID